MALGPHPAPQRGCRVGDPASSANWRWCLASESLVLGSAWPQALISFTGARAPTPAPQRGCRVGDPAPQRNLTAEVSPRLRSASARRGRRRSLYLLALGPWPIRTRGAGL